MLEKRNEHVVATVAAILVFTLITLGHANTPLARWDFSAATATTPFSFTGPGLPHPRVPGEWRPASDGQASGLFFNGKTTYVDCGTNQAYDLTSGFSLEAWIKPNAFRTYSFIVRKHDAYTLYLKSGKPAFGGWHNGAAHRGAEATEALLLNTWHHLAGTFDGQTLCIYVNGKKKAETVWEGAFQTSDEPLIIGAMKPLANPRPAMGFCGTIREVTLYQRALDEDRVRSLFEANPLSRISRPRSMSRPPIQKLGTIGPGVEATPFVHNSRLYLMIVDRSSPAKRPFRSRMVIRDLDTGKTLPPFGEGYTLASAYSEGGTVYVYATNRWGGDEIRLFRSSDLITWDSRQVLALPGWSVFNSSVCKTPDGYLMAFEFQKNAESIEHHFYSTRFARSKDLVEWELTAPECVYSKDYYNACPVIDYVDGYIYAIHLRAARGYESYLARSRDLVHWEGSPINPVLSASPEDRVIADGVTLSADVQALMKQTRNYNNSDVDLCEFKGATHIFYSWGDQSSKGAMFLSRAIFHGPKKDFLRAYFPSP